SCLPPPTAHHLPTFAAEGTSAQPREVPLAAYVFKTEPRRRGTRLAFVRVAAGRLTAGMNLVETPSGDRLGPARPVAIIGQDFEPLPALEAGEIGALVFEPGERVPKTGDTIGVAVLPFTFERMRLPDPVLEMTVEAPDSTAHDAMVAELLRQSADDPSLRVGVERETGRSVLAGMGELHLEVALRRASRALGFELRGGQPQIRERRALLTASSADATVNHPAGRARVRVVVTITPDSDLTFEVGDLPRAEWHDAVSSGLQSAAGLDGQGSTQLLGGRIQAEAEVHGGDVVPIMLRDAAEWAARRAIEAAGAVAAEPWCILTVLAPDQTIGRVVGDIARRRGRVRRTETRGVMHELTVDAPLSELVGYASDLRSLTAGRGQFSIEPTGYRVAERQEQDP
ncbi:MAG: TetM/TetW/TetO/TetS family tetracycline resistance ribosomal protection protein, partial [Myxococcales bacterium]|nr:TetM/TetW/TetO/TetS family tetracycline resistance ribosomal protection protein [Myxococcales bacterium]